MVSYEPTTICNRCQRFFLLSTAVKSYPFISLSDVSASSIFDPRCINLEFETTRPGYLINRTSYDKVAFHRAPGSPALTRALLPLPPRYLHLRTCKGIVPFERHGTEVIRGAQSAAGSRADRFEFDKVPAGELQRGQISRVLALPTVSRRYLHAEICLERPTSNVLHRVSSNPLLSFRFEPVPMQHDDRTAPRACQDSVAPFFCCFPCCQSHPGSPLRT